MEVSYMFRLESCAQDMSLYEDQHAKSRDSLKSETLVVEMQPRETYNLDYARDAAGTHR